MSQTTSSSARVFGFILLGLTSLVGVAVLLFQYLFDAKTTVTPANVAGNSVTPEPTPGVAKSTTTVSSYVTISSIPITYKRLLSTATTAHTIPSGTVEYEWKVVSGEAVINGETLPAGSTDKQSYTPGVSYGAIIITGVTGEVTLSYKKPA